MAARKPLARNNYLEEAMALLIRNQAAFVEQIARNDQERLALREWQHRTEVWQYKTEEWQRKAEERFDKIEQRLARIEESLIQLPKTILQSLLEQLPKAVKKEIGFTSPT
jgi:oligoendopeptidase F